MFSSSWPSFESWCWSDLRRTKRSLSSTLRRPDGRLKTSTSGTITRTRTTNKHGGEGQRRRSSAETWCCWYFWHRHCKQLRLSSNSHSTFDNLSFSWNNNIRFPLSYRYLFLVFISYCFQVWLYIVRISKRLQTFPIISIERVRGRHQIRLWLSFLKK